MFYLELFVIKDSSLLKSWSFWWSTWNFLVQQVVIRQKVNYKEIKMSKSKDDAPHELESQFILRLPPEYASTVRRAVQSGHVNLKDRLSIELHPDGRHGIVRV